MRKSITINSQRIVSSRQVRNVVVGAKIVGLCKHFAARDLFSWLAHGASHAAERLALCLAELCTAVTAIPAMSGAAAMAAMRPAYQPALVATPSYRTTAWSGGWRSRSTSSGSRS